MILQKTKSHGGLSQENIDLASASVDEELNMSINQRSQKALLGETTTWCNLIWRLREKSGL